MATFPQLFESVPDALLLVDQHGTIVQANAHAERLFGFGPGAMLGRPIETLVPQEARERHVRHRDGYMHQPRVRPMGAGGMTLIGQRRDGEQFPVEIALSPIDTEGGLHYLASVRDISETQRARQALQRARYDAVVARIGQRALAHADDSVLEALPGMLSEAIGVPAVGIMLGRGEEMALAHAAGIGPDDGLAEWLGAPDDALRTALAGNVPAVIRDVTVRGMPGAAAAVAPMRERDRGIGALVAFAPDAAVFDHDVLQLLQTVSTLLASMLMRRRTEEQLAHAQRLDAIGQLTGGIAHDFNNLLTVIMGSLQMLDFEYGAQAGARDVIASALRSVERGAELTGKLLAFARRQHLSPRAIDPVALLSDIAMMLRGTLGDGVRLRLDCPPQLPATFADASQLDSALVNLALNARDAMPDGGDIVIGARERWITLDPAEPERPAGHYIVFTVADTGRGMTPDVRERAFEPFFTTKAIGRGSGLGLSMVYGFVKQSGGHLSIDSAPGHGTRIDLLLPVAASQGHAAAPVPGGARGQGTVLVVEDEREVRDIAAAFLHSFGYDVVAVGSAAAAIERLASDAHIDLMFSDVMLGGGMDGIELARAARGLRPGLGILLTSGYDAATAHDAPTGFEFLRKPYRRETLAQAVARNLPSEP